MFKGSQINTFNTKDLSDANIILDNLELCPDGSTFALSGEKTVALISFTRDEPYDDLTLKSRVTSMCWLDDENLLVGMENGSIEWTNINTSERMHLPNIHPRRIKGMHHLKGFLGTICSNGTISLWATEIAKKKLTLISTTTDESVRPTCIKLIDITENRYKEPVNNNNSIDADKLKDSLSSSVKTPRPITTTGKVIVETDRNEVDDETPTTNQNWKLQVSDDDDSDNELGVTSKKKKKTTNTPHKKKAMKSPGVSVASSEKEIEPEARVPKRKTPKKTVQKPIVVRSPNSDDDFEIKRPKQEKMVTAKVDVDTNVKQTKRKSNSDSTKKSPKTKSKSSSTPNGSQILTENTQSQTTTPTSLTVPKNDTSTVRSSRKKSKLSGSTLANGTPAVNQVTKTPKVGSSIVPDQKKSRLSSLSLSNGTSIVKRDKKSAQATATPTSCVTTIQNGAKSQPTTKKRKLVVDLNKSEPSHLMATRKNRKYTM